MQLEVSRLYGLLERCENASLDIPSKSLMDEQPGFVFQEIFMNHLSKVSLPVILLVSFLLKKRALQLQELSRKYIMGSQEDAPIGKRLAYGVDILFSTRPYMKPTALLLATVLLICGGGIALFAVSDDSLSDAMWRSWTYVADSGNHADSQGTWPRIVSVLISFGGMLIFALMLGLISDAISEKVDSLRKGKSEVIESGHTLILGWSDKLVNFFIPFTIMVIIALLRSCSLFQVAGTCNNSHLHTFLFFWRYPFTGLKDPYVNRLVVDESTIRPRWPYNFSNLPSSNSTNKVYS